MWLTTSCPSGSRKTENQPHEIGAYISIYLLPKIELTHAELIALVAVANNAVWEMDSGTTKQHLDEDLETVRGQLKCLHIGVFEMPSKPALNS
jgi:hypothetical protein